MAARAPLCQDPFAFWSLAVLDHIAPLQRPLELWFVRAQLLEKGLIELAAILDLATYAACHPKNTKVSNLLNR